MSRDKISLTIAGGLGEIVNYAPKIGYLLKDHGVEKLDFYIVGTYSEVTPLIVDLCEALPYTDEVYIGNNTYPQDYKENIDWRPDDNPMKYTIDLDFKFPVFEYSEKWADEILKNETNPIIIHPYSLGGTERSVSEKYVRSPEEKWWIELFDKIIAKGGTPVVIGGELEKIDWNKDGVIYAYTDDIFNTLSLVLRGSGYIGIMSWPSFIAHYSNKMDVCQMMLCHQHWKDRYFSEDRSKITQFLTIPTHEEIISSIGVLK